MAAQVGAVPFRVLGDPGRSLISAVGGGTLPIAWVLDDEMIINGYTQGARAETVIDWMENLLR